MLQKIIFFCSISFLFMAWEGYAQQPYFILNAECSHQVHCVGDTLDPALAVVCINSRCICDPRLGIYDKTRYQCVGKADHACLRNICTRNAVCETSTNTCKCRPGYDVNAEGHCVRGHEEICDEDEDCKSGLLCYNGKCECRYPNHQYYHEDNQTCYSIAQPWDANFKNNECADNKSSLFQCLELLLIIVQIGRLVRVGFVLAKIGMTLREVVGTFKFHGYFLRSGMESKIQDGSGMQIESASFFDGGKV